MATFFFCCPFYLIKFFSMTTSCSWGVNCSFPEIDYKVFHVELIKLVVIKLISSFPTYLRHLKYFNHDFYKLLIFSFIYKTRFTEIINDNAFIKKKMHEVYL